MPSFNVTLEGVRTFVTNSIVNVCSPQRAKDQQTAFVQLPTWANSSTRGAWEPLPSGQAGSDLMLNQFAKSLKEALGNSENIAPT